MLKSDEDEIRTRATEVTRLDEQLLLWSSLVWRFRPLSHLTIVRFGLFLGAATVNSTNLIDDRI